MASWLHDDDDAQSVLHDALSPLVRKLNDEQVIMELSRMYGIDIPLHLKLSRHRYTDGDVIPFIVANTNRRGSVHEFVKPITNTDPGRCLDDRRARVRASLQKACQAGDVHSRLAKHNRKAGRRGVHVRFDGGRWIIDNNVHRDETQYWSDLKLANMDTYLGFLENVIRENTSAIQAELARVPQASRLVHLLETDAVLQSTFLDMASRCVD